VIGGPYAHRRLGGEKLRWLWFAVAGAMPGLAPLVAEALTRIGAARALARSDD
jgi:hypothetical protein